jgi:hypothetical protein
MKLDLTGQTFGRLTATVLSETRGKGRKRTRYWLCRCVCGRETWVKTASLVGGYTISCGCAKGKPARHGHNRHGHRSPTYSAWSAMWTRCTNRNQRSADRYVKRGITVCKRWKSFEAFLEDMGERPSGRSLERKNNNLGYSKENCKWGTADEQNRNKGNTKLTFEGAVQIASRILRGETAKVVANDFAICTGYTSAIGRGKTWNDAFLQAKAGVPVEQIGQMRRRTFKATCAAAGVNYGSACVRMWRFGETWEQAIAHLVAYRRTKIEVTK